MASSLSIRNLSISFGGIKALDDVSLDVGPRSFVGMMGPNGAGKTTVINCVSRIYKPQSGEVKFDGVDLLKLSGDQVLNLGIARTFQDLGFFGHISSMLVIDYLRLGQFNESKNFLLRDGLQLSKSREYERELKKRSRRILEFFREVREELEPPEEERGYPILYGREGFPDLLDLEFRPIGFLSFAWRRRLDLARALVSQPRLLLLDEPAQGLPPTEIDKLGRTLKHIQNEYSVSALIVEHNVSTLMNISDSIIAMSLGKKIGEGLPEEIKNNKAVIEIYLGSSTSQPLDGSSPHVNSVAEKAEPSTLSGPLLEVQNLDLYYGSAQALFSVSISIKANQVTSILGTNGSGKSSLLRAISGIEKPSFGEIRFKGIPVPLGWPEVAVERGIQYVPQGHVIFPELSVRDNLKIGALVFEKKGLKFKTGLEKVLHYFSVLEPYLNVQAASLSGGLQQMLAIGQAIMGQPDLLLLDEPSLGLSPKMVETLFAIIKRISIAEKCAVMLVEQNVNKALEVSDYIYMLSSGVLIGEGTSQKLQESDATIKKYLGFC